MAFITGGANILGPEFAAALAEFGATVVVSDVNGEACRRVAARVRDEFGARVEPLALDVTDEAAVAAALANTRAEFGRIDVLINAARAKGEGYFQPTADYPLATWDRVMAANLTGAFLCVKHVLPHFTAERRGNIINVASHYGVIGPDPRIYAGSMYEGQPINTPAVYAASKGGLVNFTRYLATTLADRGIRANCISPGGVFSGENETFVGQYSARVPLGRMGRREELRGALLFLASDASSYVTGQNLIVDGGWTAW